MKLENLNPYQREIVESLRPEGNVFKELRISTNEHITEENWNSLDELSDYGVICIRDTYDYKIDEGTTIITLEKFPEEISPLILWLSNG